MKSYHRLTRDSGKKVTISSRVDLCDLYTALKALRNVLDVSARGMSRSSAVSKIVEAFASSSFQEGIVEEEDLPRTREQAIRKLELEFGFIFDSNRNQREIAGEESEFSFGVSSLEEEKAEEFSEEEFREAHPEINTQETLGEEEVARVFSSLREKGPPISSLIQAGQNAGWSDEDIASKLKPLARKEKSDISDEEVHELFEFFQNQ